jgi:two-component system, OmpR family, sensor histidine kinase KdpD
MTTRNLVTTVVVTAACTLAVAVLDTFMPAQSAGVVYLAGVLYVSSRLGLWPGLATCALSALAFNFFFLPPRYTFVISSTGDWLTLALYGVTAVVTSGLAARVRDQAAEAERRAHESELALRFATSVARRSELEPTLDELGAEAGAALGARGGVIVLDDVPAGPREIPLFSGDRRIGRLELVEPPAILDANTAARIGAMLGGLIAIAQERDRLAAAR